LASHPSCPEISANIASGVSPAEGQGEETIPPEGIEGEEQHFCLYLEGQALVRVRDVDGNPILGLSEEPFDPEAFGFVEAEANDLFLSGEAGDETAAANDVLEFWRQGGLDAFELSESDAPDAPDLLSVIAAVHDEGFQAAPHYLLQPAGFWRYGPYSSVARLDPALVWDDLDSTGPTGAPAGSRLVVIDTGASDLSGIGITVTEPEVDDSVAYPLDSREVGHGTFAASIAKQYNPSLNVEVYRANWMDGTFDEASVVAAFQRAEVDNETVVSLSAGTYPCSTDYNPLGLGLAMSSQVVAASGNDGSNHVPQQLYPASHSDVIGVSAFDVAWDEATWANHGEVYAPGEDVVGWYDNGTGGSLAAWSGTSFATPHYAACIASEVCATP
jgi:hypothetical protein